MREPRALPTRSHFRRAANVRFRVGALLAVQRWGLVTFLRPSRVRGGGALLAAPKAASKLPELRDASRPPFRSLGRGRGGPRPRGGDGAGVLRVGWGGGGPLVLWVEPPCYLLSGAQSSCCQTEVGSLPWLTALSRTWLGASQGEWNPDCGGRHL